MRVPVWVIVVGGVLALAGVGREGPARQPLAAVVATAPNALERPAMAGAGEPAVAAPSSGRRVWLRVTASSLNVRADPGEAAARVGVAGRGTRARLLERRGGWARVELPAGTVGWVSARHLGAEESPSSGSARRSGAPPAAPVVPDDAVRRSIVAASVAAYAGSCPCPDFRDRAGRRCGRRSAYSRDGGDAPLCHARDVTDAMVAEYRAASSPR